MLASYLLSRTLVPDAGAHLLARSTRRRRTPRAGDGSARASTRWRDATFDRFQERYAAAARGVLATARFVLVVAAVLAVAASLPGSVGRARLLPEVDAGLMRLHFRAPPGTRIEETERLVDAVEQTHPRDHPGRASWRPSTTMIGMPLSYNLAFVQTDNVGGRTRRC